jgi:hypothetical protein
LAKDGFGVGGVDVTEDVGVSADEFFAGVARGIFQGEGATLGGEVGMKDNLKEKIAEFFAEIGIIGIADGVDGFAGFLKESGAEGFVGLLAVPRTALGRAEEADDGAEAGDGFRREFF